MLSNRLSPMMFPNETPPRRSSKNSNRNENSEEEKNGRDENSHLVKEIYKDLQQTKYLLELEKLRNSNNSNNNQNNNQNGNQNANQNYQDTINDNWNKNYKMENQRPTIHPPVMYPNAFPPYQYIPSPYCYQQIPQYNLPNDRINSEREYQSCKGSKKEIETKVEKKIYSLIGILVLFFLFLFTFVWGVVTISKSISSIKMGSSNFADYTANSPYLQPFCISG